MLPSSYIEKAQVCLSALKYMMDNNREPYSFGMIFSSLSNINMLTRQTMEQLFRPVWKYIDEKVDGMDSLLYLLLRFKLECEWFNKNNLYQNYLEDTRRGEQLLDKELRQYLLVTIFLVKQ